MYKVLLLICAIGIDHGHCTAENAYDVIEGPAAPDLVSCALQSQAYLASTAVGSRPGGHDYLKIVCARSGIQPRIVG